MSFGVKVLRKADEDLLFLVGPINEDTGLALLKLYELTSQRCVINFKGVTVVNSNGVRNWIDFLRTFSEGRSVVFEHCTPAVVAMMAMIGSFRSKATVRSLYGTFSCPVCAREQVWLLETAIPAEPSPGAAEAALVVPVVHCDCGEAMELDDRDDLEAVAAG